LITITHPLLGELSRRRGDWPTSQPDHPALHEELHEIGLSKLLRLGDTETLGLALILT
jgi:hypothetical protein